MHDLQTLKKLHREADSHRAHMQLRRLGRDDKVNIVNEARLAMNTLDQWLAEAESLFIGREVVRTHEGDALCGAVSKITSVAIAQGASGYHLFFTAPVTQVERECDDMVTPRTDEQHTRLAKRASASRALLELGVTCELLALDDTPTGDH